jgi:hypothetical protein
VQKADPVAAKRQSLKMVETATRRLAKAEAEYQSCIAFAAESGNSSREIATAAGVLLDR